ncbi:MAG: uroporphyrinogen-III synthase [Nitriliruptoraceae bacterium]
MSTLKPVLLIRPGLRNSDDAAALDDLDIPHVIDPYLDVAPSDDPDAITRARQILAAIRDDADWLVITSAQAVLALAALTSQLALGEALTVGSARGLRVAAVGDATANALHATCRLTVHCPKQATAQALAKLLLTLDTGAKAVIPLSAQAAPTLTETLTSGGWQVTDAPVYATKTVRSAPVSAAQIAEQAFSAIVLRSPTAVRALHQYSPSVPKSTTLVCGGPTTAAEALRLFTAPIVTSNTPAPTAVAEAVYHAVSAGSDNEL